MRQLRAFLRRLTGLLPNPAAERDLSEEIESHLRLHTDDNLRAGMSPEEARRAAILRLGGVEPIKEALAGPPQPPVGRNAAAGPPLLSAPVASQCRLHHHSPPDAQPWHVRRHCYLRLRRRSPHQTAALSRFNTTDRRVRAHREVLDDAAYTVIGVLPRDFHFALLAPAEFWAALHPESPSEARRSCHNLYGVGRLGESVSLAAAQSEIARIAHLLEQ
jgi:hypothetical protein